MNDAIAHGYVAPGFEEVRDDPREKALRDAIYRAIGQATATPQRAA